MAIDLDTFHDVIRQHVPRRVPASFDPAEVDRSPMPGVAAIVRHWAPWLVQMGRAPSVPEALAAEPWCFGCGFGWTGRGLVRAHIRAHARGGSESPANLHLLCHACHCASEQLSGGAYWRWFARRLPADVYLINALAAGS